MTKLLTAQNCEGEVHLIVGVSTLTPFRVESIKQAGASPILVSSVDKLPVRLEQQVANGDLKWIQRDFDIELDLTSLGRDEVDSVVDKVFVTSKSTSEMSITKLIYEKCKRLRIPINVTNCPELCTFTLLSTYSNGDFQLGITTSGKGCHLASRIKRELINTLPANIDVICNTVGELRHRIQEEDLQDLKNKFDLIDDSNEEDSILTLKLNELVHEFEMSENEKRLQRTRWLSQIVEYYPLKKLATISIDDLSNAYHQYQSDNKQIEVQTTKKGSISLIGSGPGAVSLLSVGALAAIYSADLILADKLVPQQILDIIPRSSEVFIARKFPGNAELAQEELLNMGLQALQKNQNVIRLKQGDPYIFGRGGEEYKFFESHGFEPIVLPGITSALAAPVMAQIPVTHRQVSDQVLIMTGTGRRGILPNLPLYEKSRTTVFLMAMHRIIELVPELVENKGWDPELPCCILERASCPDQRVVRTTLKNVAELYELCGSRPPGLLVTGWACNVLKPIDPETKWVVEEGCNVEDSNIIGLKEIISNLSA